jgi:opacity protein-like surface antigen
MKKIIYITTILIFITNLIYAKENKWYIEYSIGQTYTNSQIKNINATLDEKGLGHKLNIGYNWYKYFSTEVFYSKLEGFSIKGPGTLYDNVAEFEYDTQEKISTQMKSFGLVGVLKYPIYKYIEPFVKFGIQKYTAKLKSLYSINSSSVSKNEKGIKTIYSIGANFPIRNNVSIKLEYEIYNVDKSLLEEKYFNINDIKFLSLGLKYKF